MVLDENFSYGYDEGKYNLRVSNDSVFRCFYKEASYIPKSFKEECIKVCEKISDYSISEKKLPMILLSGGADSEVVVRSFIDAGRKFLAVTNRFKHGLNQHEVDYVIDFQKKYKFDLKFVDIDVEEWLLSSEADMMAEESKCTVPEMLPTMKLIDQVYFNLGGIPVLGNGDLYVSKDVDMHSRIEHNKISYVWNYVEFEYILAWMRYAVQKKIIGAINFFQYTPEIVLAMGLHPKMRYIFNNNSKGKQSSRSTKYLVYKDNWDDLLTRPKFHGGEKIYDICDYLRKNKLAKYRGYSQKWKKPVELFFKDLGYHDDL